MRSNEMPAYLCLPEPGLLAAVKAPAQWTWQLFFCIFTDKRQSTSLRYWQISPNWLGIVGETINIPFTLLFEWPYCYCVLYSTLALISWHVRLVQAVRHKVFSGILLFEFILLWYLHEFFLHCFFLPHLCLESSCCSSVGNRLSCGPASKAYVKSDTISGVQILWWLLES